MHEEPTFSIGTPRVSGTSRAVKMSAMVCQTPKKTNTPYFIVHIIMRKTCRMTANSYVLKIFIFSMKCLNTTMAQPCHIYQA